MYKKPEEEPRWGRGHLTWKVPKRSSWPGEMEEAETTGLWGRVGSWPYLGVGGTPKGRGVMELLL